jgi:probable phosphoglycerate mutase
MSTLYVVTHAEASHHVDRRVGGWYDSELTSVGRRHADAIAAELGSRLHAAPVLYSSDLKRATQTAAPIGRAFSVEPILTADLREAGCGIAEGKPRAWLDENIVLPPRDGNRLDHRICEDAETRREIAARIYRFVDQFLSAPPETAVIVTHGFALTFVISAWLDTPIESLGRVRYHADSGSLTRLEIDPDWGDRTLTSFNETAHLRLAAQ